MKAPAKTRLAFATTVYWVLLVYIIAALVFWFIELEKQNRQMTSYRISELVKDQPDYTARYKQVEDDRRRKTAQYIGEGVTFLALIILGAIYVYRSVRRQFRMQQQQQHFMMAVTHELKTPIAVAQLNLETLQKHQLDEVRKQRLITLTLQETNRLNNLASNILVSSQLEGGRYTLSREVVDFSDMVSRCVSEFKNRFAQRNWTQQIADGIELSGDVLLLPILVNNLLENALKYSPSQSTIHVELSQQANSVMLSVSDEGEGIAPEERKQIFEKFYRIGNEQTRSAKGTGLGLYLCKKIAQDHNASIRVSDKKPKGSIFTVTFNV